MCACTHFPQKKSNLYNILKESRIGGGGQTWVEPYLIIFVFCTTISITVVSSPKQCMVGTQLPVIQLTQLFSLVLSLSFLTSHGDAVRVMGFLKLFLSHTHARALSPQFQSPAFHAVALHSLTLWKSKRDPILPPHPRQPNICLFWPKGSPAEKEMPSMA